jgi:hypothetical protein
VITVADVASVNLGVRFATELTALAALGFWGFQLGGSPPVSIVLAVALPLAMGAVWGAVVAPRARWRLSDPARLLVELGLFVAATVGIAATAGLVLAAGFVVVVVVNIALMFVWAQRQTA